MFFRIGSFQHPDNLVNTVAFNQRNILNSRGRVQLTRKTLHIQVTLIAVGTTPDEVQASLTSQIQDIESAYSSNGQDAGLYQDDGTVTPHFLDSSRSIGGVRVLNLDFQKNDGAEYATQRTVNITLEADFASSQAIVSFQESLSFVGTAGPQYAWVQVLNGPPQRQTLKQKTTQMITQAGSGVGFLSAISVPPPLLPRLEHLGRRRITPGAPRLDNNRFVDFPTSWTYVFESPTPIQLQPTRR